MTAPGAGTSVERSITAPVAATLEVWIALLGALVWWAPGLGFVASGFSLVAFAVLTWREGHRQDC